MSKSVLEAEHLQKTYGKVMAVEDFTFAAHEGEIFGLLGPNGAGKTTVMHMLAGLLAPDAGTIRIKGEIDPTRPSVRRSLGIATQSLAIYDELTAEENLEFMANLQGLRGRAKRSAVERGLAIAELTGRRKSRISTFSGGMKRRLNLACALIHQPDLVLLDEPTAGVDPQSRNFIFECIERIAQQGQTVIYTTHYMEEAERLCKRVAIIDHGKSLAMNTVESLIKCYGGESMLTAELSRPPEHPELLPGQLDGLHWQYSTNKPMEDIRLLLSSDVEIRDLHAALPNLETVFLNLTGRSLRA